MIATIGRFLCLTNPHRSRRALFVRAKQHNGNPSDRSGGRLPLHRGAKGAPAGVQRIFRISGFLSRENGTPQAAAAASSPCTGEPRGSCGGCSVFFEYRASFHGGTAIPQAAAAASSPYTGEPRGLLRGYSVFFEYWASFHGRTATPQAAAAASSPYTWEPRGIHADDPVQKRVSGGEPLGTLFFDLRQQLFGYCKNTSPHPRRR